MAKKRHNEIDVTPGAEVLISNHEIIEREAPPLAALLLPVADKVDLEARVQALEAQVAVLMLHVINSKGGVTAKSVTL